MKRNFIYSKISSNFIIEARTVLLSHAGVANPFQIQVFWGNTDESALRADPISASDSDFQFWREGEIRTRGPPEADACFPSKCTRPLCDLSTALEHIISHQIIAEFTPLFKSCNIRQ